MGSNANPAIPSIATTKNGHHHNDKTGSVWVKQN